MALLCPVDARGALHQPAMTAQENLQAPGEAFRLVDEFEGIPAAEIAKIGVHALRSGEESGNHDPGFVVTNALIIHDIFGRAGITQPGLHRPGNGLELLALDGVCDFLVLDRSGSAPNCDEVQLELHGLIPALS